jgi:hypothetical protein
MAAAAGNLDGFGVVTLASLLPVLAVQLLSIGIAGTKSESEVLAYISAHVAAGADSGDVLERSPVLRDVVFASRAILPLAAALVLFVLVLLRSGLPPLSFTAGTAAVSTTADAAVTSGAGAVVLEAYAGSLVEEAPLSPPAHSPSAAEPIGAAAAPAASGSLPMAPTETAAPPDASPCPLAAQETTQAQRWLILLLACFEALVSLPYTSVCSSAHPAFARTTH